MVTIEQMQGHFDRMKVEVADSADQSLKEHFARHPQEFFSEPAMMKIMGLLKRQCDGHHMELGDKMGRFATEFENFRRAHEENGVIMRDLNVSVARAQAGLAGMQSTFVACRPG